MALDNISTEFAYEFFSQIKRFSEERGIEKVENKGYEEVRLIRNVLAGKKQKVKVIEKESAVEKIKKLMEDSTIDSIECNGPDKDIMIRRNDDMTRTNIKLNNKEIREIFEVIENENNERLGRIFKTNFRDFIISGIKSAFIGSSFMLYRKNANVY